MTFEFQSASALSIVYLIAITVEAMSGALAAGPAVVDPSQRVSHSGRAVLAVRRHRASC